MSFIPLPYHYRPRKAYAIRLADIILIASVLFFAAVCLAPISQN